MAVRRNAWVKVVIGLVAVVGLGWLFLRTVQESRSAAYAVGAADLSGWQLAIGDPDDPAAPLVSLRAPSSLTPGLFKQIFARTMESLSSPADPRVPLVLRTELGPAPPLVTDDLLAAAREAGPELTALVPRCLALHRISEPSNPRDYYFLIFDDAPVRRFRARVATLMAERDAGAPTLDPQALLPVLVVATSDRTLRGALPFVPDPERDCLASIDIV